jgi:hypothetical protein
LNTSHKLHAISLLQSFRLHHSDVNDPHDRIHGQAQTGRGGGGANRMIGQMVGHSANNRWWINKVRCIGGHSAKKLLYVWLDTRSDTVRRNVWLDTRPDTVRRNCSTYGWTQGRTQGKQEGTAQRTTTASVVTAVDSAAVGAEKAACTLCSLSARAIASGSSVSGSSVIEGLILTGLLLPVAPPSTADDDVDDDD